MVPLQSSSKNPFLSRRQKTNSAIPKCARGLFLKRAVQWSIFCTRIPRRHKNFRRRSTTTNACEKNSTMLRKRPKEVARKVSIKIPHFKDCKYHKGDKKRGDESTIFITEGPSAAGSMVAARDVETQAIFGLKGVPLNVFGKTKAAIYKNEELYNLMTALGIEDSVENLRFNNVVIATDADYDGFPHPQFADDFFPQLLRRTRHFWSCLYSGDANFSRAE